MSDQVSIQETINEARMCLLNAVKLDAGRRALEGVIESAFERLEEARDALTRGDWAVFGRAFDVLGTTLRPASP